MRTVSLKKLVMARIFSERVVKSAFYVSIRMFREFSFRSFKNSFGPRAGDSAFRRFFFQRVCQNNNLHIQRDSSMKNNYSKNVFCSDHFRTMSEKFLAVWQFLSAWVVKTACYVSVGNFRGKKTLDKNFFVKFGYWTRILWLLSNFLQGGCKNCLLHVHRKNLKEKKFRPKKLFLPNSHKLRTFLAFGWNLSAGFSKLHYTCSLKQFQKKSFWKKCSFNHNVG